MPTSVTDRIREESFELLRTIADAASNGDTQAVLTLTERLRAADALIERLTAISHDAERFLDHDVDRPLTPTRPAAATVVLAPSPGAASVPGRGHGPEIRAAFLRTAAAHGVCLEPIRGAIYMAPNGKRVGIAVATERQRNRWFLGLPEGGFESAALICQTSSGKRLDICIPPAFFAEHERRLSRSSGQVKFNVVRRDGRLLLTIPRSPPAGVDQFLDALANLT
jgi:hypothetical protein